MNSFETTSLTLTSINPDGGDLFVNGGSYFTSEANTKIAMLGRFDTPAPSTYNIISTNNHGDFTIGNNLKTLGDERDLATVNDHSTMKGSAIVLAGNEHPAGTNSISFYTSAGVASADAVMDWDSPRMVIKNNGEIETDTVKFGSVTVVNGVWQNLFHVQTGGVENQSSMASNVRVAVEAHGGNHVVSFIATVIVNHSKNVYVRTEGGNYTKPDIRIRASNGNYYFAVRHTNASSNPKYNYRIEALNRGTNITVHTGADEIDYHTSTYGVEHVHQCLAGTHITGSGNKGDIRLGGGLALVKSDSANEASESNYNLMISENYTSSYQGYHWLDTTAYYIGQNSQSRDLRFYSSSETTGLRLAPGGTSFGTFSDERLKRDITLLDTCTDKLMNIKPISYNLLTDESGADKRIGLSAQSLVGQIDQVLDQAKHTKHDDTQYYSIRYTELIPVLVKGFQEQQALIEQQQARIEQLESKLT